MPSTREKAIQESHPHPKYPRLAVQLRRKSRFYQGVVFLDGRKRQKSLKTDRLSTAFKLGEEWYTKLLRASVSEARQHPIDRLGTDPTVGEVFADYRLTLPTAKRAYADMKWSTIADFWRTMAVTDVTPQVFRQFYTWRRRHKTPQGTVIKNNSIHKDMMVVRQVLNYAIEEKHIAALPIIPKVGKIAANPRPWLTRGEFDTLIDASTKRRDAAGQNSRLYTQRNDLHEFVFFMVESMMRVSEVRELTVGQCRVVEGDGEKHEPHLVIDVVGKTGHRTAVAGGLAPAILARRSDGLKGRDRLWSHGQRDAFRELLIAAGLRTDQFGNNRNLKSLRATAISFRILEQAPNPDLLMIARNAGTSVAMIDTFYAKRLESEMGAGRLSTSLL